MSGQGLCKRVATRVQPTLDPLLLRPSPACSHFAKIPPQPRVLAKCQDPCWRKAGCYRSERWHPACVVYAAQWGGSAAAGSATGGGRRGPAVSTSEPAAGHCARGRAPARRSSGVDRAVGRDLAGHRPGHRSAARARPAHLPPSTGRRWLGLDSGRCATCTASLLRFLGCTADARDGAARRWRQHRADGDGPNHDGEHRRGRARTGPIPRSRLASDTTGGVLLAWAMTDRVRRSVRCLLT